MGTDSKPDSGAPNVAPERKKAVAKRKSNVPPSSSISTPSSAKKQKSDQDDIELEAHDVDVRAIKAEPEPSGSGASSAVPIVEADLGDESYGGAEGDDNGDFGAGDEFEGFDQYGDGAEFDDSLGAAGGSGAATDGKDFAFLEEARFCTSDKGAAILLDTTGFSYSRGF